MKHSFVFKDFIIITLISSIWVHCSEVFRYFIFVRPEMQRYLFELDNVADMNWTIFIVWGVWDTLLSALCVFLFWLCAVVFGNNLKAIVISSMTAWCFFFVLFWLGMANMNLSSWEYLLTVLPLALLEMLVAALIISKLYMRKGLV